MTPYRVRHNASGAVYYLLAETSSDAFETVTLRLGALDGRAAWTASPDVPTFTLAKGVVYDHKGEPVKSVEW